MSREYIVITNRITAKYYNLTAFLARVKCKCNYESEDINHLYDSQRAELIKKLLKIKFQLPLNIETIVAKPNLASC